MNDAALKRFADFVDERKEDIWWTHVDDAHNNFSKYVISLLQDRYGLAGKQVLDVGCGTGRDLKAFAELGAIPTGMTLYEEDALTECKLPYIVADQAFNDLPEKSYDIVFARHVLEHSLAPFFTLTSYNRLLKAGGTLYVEVPAPDQKTGHELNHNHYSVFGLEMWQTLIKRAGFEIKTILRLPINSFDAEGNIIENADLWYGFICEKYRDDVVPSKEWWSLVEPLFKNGFKIE